MRRREVIASLGAALCCSPKVMAQATSRVYRVGLLSTLAPISNESEQGAAFISAMSRAGYVLGQISSLSGAVRWARWSVFRLSFRS